MATRTAPRRPRSARPREVPSGRPRRRSLARARPRHEHQSIGASRGRAAALDARAGTGCLRVPASHAPSAMGRLRVSSPAGLARSARARWAAAGIRPRRAVLIGPRRQTSTRPRSGPCCLRALSSHRPPDTICRTATSPANRDGITASLTVPKSACSFPFLLEI